MATFSSVQLERNLEIIVKEVRNTFYLKLFVSLPYDYCLVVAIDFRFTLNFMLKRVVGEFGGN